MLKERMLRAVSGSGGPVGQALFTESGSWTCPAGVTSVCVVCIGGGEGGDTSFYPGGGVGGSLRYKNDITVVPGNSYTVTVGAGGTTALGNGGASWFGSTTTVLAKGGGTTTTQYGTGGDGGVGGAGRLASYYHGGGGGGAGGYSGAGGAGGDGYNGGSPTSGEAGAAGAGGAGGGGAGGSYNGTSNASGGNGGGVGPWGQGASGAASSGQGNPGSDGIGKLWGAGGGGYFPSVNPGADGCVRIIWGADRAFPSTNTQDIYEGTEVSLVGSDTIVDPNGGAVSFDISGVGHAVGDLGIFLFTSDTNNITVAPTGWTQYWTSGDDLPRSYIYTRTMTGSETSINFTAGTNTQPVIGGVVILRGSSGIGDVPVNSASWSILMPDPPISTGDGTFVLAVGFLDDDAVTATAQSGYTMVLSEKTAGTGSDSSLMVSYKAGASAYEDVGRFAGSGSDNWWALSMRFSRG